MEYKKPLSDSRNLREFLYAIEEDFQDAIGDDDDLFGHYLQISGGCDRPGLPYQSARVTPTELTKTLCRNNILSDAGTLYYQLILFSDDAALHVAYNSIIGSRLLAFVDLETLPKWIKLTPEPEDDATT